MRNEKRIGVFLKYVNWQRLLVDIWKIYSLEDCTPIIRSIKSEIPLIRSFWKANPDLRISQILVNLGYINNSPGFWYYLEENEILDQLGIEPRLFLIWGSIFNKKGAMKKKYTYKPICALDTDHIQAILNGEYTRNPLYLDAFNAELNNRGVV